MKISYNWLKDYIDTDLTPEETAERLTLVGLEVEELESIGPDLEGFVVGEVLSVAPHPSADRLRLCQVDLGERQVQIVCGADNVAAGQKVPVATIGATLPVAGPDGSRLKIRKAKLRGEVSEGMICSQAELGIGGDHSGIMVLDAGLAAGLPLSDALGQSRDTVFEIGLTPNRPDAACHVGVARDLGAVLNRGINHPAHQDPLPEQEGEIQELLDLQIKDTLQCRRYTAMMVRNVTVAESPSWLKEKLQAIGLRPINNVVDITNFILHELGQPLHAFDFDKIRGDRIVVRHYDTDRKFRTLDDVERTVPAGTLFICDGEGPVALAGIMGGADSEVTGQTRTVLIESACFDPSSIRRASRSIHLQSDASYRYERGTDPEITLAACLRAAKLIAELAGGEIVTGYRDEYPSPAEPLQIPLRIERLNALLGTALEESEAIAILNRLEFETTPAGNGVVECRVPTFRPDVMREVDLIEEVGRIFDYNNIPAPESVPFLNPSPLNAWEQMHQRTRQIATSLRFREIATNSLLSDEEESLFSEKEAQIRTLNPVSADATTLRSTLLSGYLKALQFNLNRNATQIRFFEIGRTYRKSGKGTWIDGIEEHSKLLMGICGYRKTEDWRGKAELYTIFDLKEDLEAFLSKTGLRNRMQTRLDPARPEQLEYWLDGNRVALLLAVPEPIAEKYDIELPAYAAEVDLTLLHASGYGVDGHSYRKVSRFPVFEYDVAYIMDDAIPAGEVADRIRQTAGEALHSLEVFDVYQGEPLDEGKKSIAFRLTFIDRNKTLNIKDVDPIVKSVTRVLGQEMGAILRS